VPPDATVQSLSTRRSQARPENHRKAGTGQQITHAPPHHTPPQINPTASTATPNHPSTDSGLRTYDHHATLPRITADATVISGGADILTPATHARELADTIPNAHHIHRPNAGHMLLHEAARTVTDAINRTTHATLPADTGA
jgi:pimeloyl-ACP methyl ester carboxylesterase